MKLVLSFFFFLVSVSANALDVEAHPFNKYHKGNYSFDGKSVVPKDLSLNFDNNNSVVSSKDSQSEYGMKWSKEKNESSDLMTITEFTKIKDPLQPSQAPISVRTSSFDGNYLRSSTVCSGTQATSLGRTTTNLKCVTATRQVCDQLMSAYSKESKQCDLLQATVKNDPTEVPQSGEKCKDLVGSYAKMASAFDGVSSQVASRRDEVITQDFKRIKTYLGPKLLDQTTINSNSAFRDLGELKRTDPRMLPAIQSLNLAIRTCGESSSDFKRPTGVNAPKINDFRDNQNTK